MDQQVNVCLFVCFQVLTQLGGCTNYSRKEVRGSGGRLRSIYPIYSSWGAEKGRLQITDSVVLVQDDRMGFHICIVGY